MQGTPYLKDFQLGLTVLTHLGIFTNSQHSLTAPFHYHFFLTLNVLFLTLQNLLSARL